MWLFKKPTPGRDDIKNAYKLSLSLQDLMRKIKKEKDRLFDKSITNNNIAWRKLQEYEKQAERMIALMHQKLKIGVRRLK